MTIQTRSQQFAQRAYQRIAARNPDDEYRSFARSFPSLIHTCGLAQALAFAKAKEKSDYLEDLAAVLSTQADTLERHSREHPVSGYIRLSRNALEAANWLKRYVEAAKEGT
ncbi:MAG: type III-B CRISPR module-associated protein Cmr5 [Nitrospirae bacterium]|nr:MAG: type III-B CRISPR module-associated protein Cmr5 [Nitrospirota bacterium]